MIPDLDDTVVRAPRPAAPSPEDADADTIPVAARPVIGAMPAPSPVAPNPVPASGALRVRLPDGSVIALDRTVYLGRRPSLPRVHPGGEPVLITLVSPDHELSSTHLSLSAVGGSYVARDMLSTNGTVVRSPGAPERLLLRGESAVLTPGTIIDLGEGHRLEVLAP